MPVELNTVAFTSMGINEYCHASFESNFIPIYKLQHKQYISIVQWGIKYGPHSYIAIWPLEHRHMCLKLHASEWL